MSPAKKPPAKKPPVNKPSVNKPPAKGSPARNSPGNKPATGRGPGSPAGESPAAGEAAAAPPFVLSALAAELGAPSPALIAALLQETPDSELVERGTQIASARVVTDGARMLGIGWTFYKGASAEQKRRLRGCSRELFTLGVSEVLRLEQLLDQQEAQRQHEGSVRQVSAVAQGAAWDTALGLRDQAADALRGAAGSLQGRAAVTESVGTADSAAALARGLESLAKLLEGWLHQATGTERADEALKLRLALFALDAEYVKELRRAAEALRQTEAAAQNRPQTARVSQVQLDRQDGLCLLLLDRLMRAFERGHALDPTIPRLVPLATRSVLSRRRSGQKDAPDTTPAPSPAPVPPPA